MVYFSPKTVFRAFSASTPVVFRSSAFERALQIFALDPHQQHVIAVNNWEEKILVNFVNIETYCILKSVAGKFHSELVNQRPRDILDTKVACMAAMTANFVKLVFKISVRCSQRILQILQSVLF